MVHLADLLLRRLRLGLTLPDGGLSQIEQMRAVVQDELGWNDDRWESEVDAYENLWRLAYAPSS